MDKKEAWRVLALFSAKLTGSIAAGAQCKIKNVQVDKMCVMGLWVFDVNGMSGQALPSIDFIWDSGCEDNLYV